VTALAFHAFMTALQRKFSQLVVIKGGRNPSLRSVAFRAGNPFRFGSELAAMHVPMALFAALRCPFELNFLPTLHWFVTPIASYGAMDSEQGELSLAMVKTLNLYPRIGVVACLTAKDGATRAAAGHALAEFSVVWVGMAGGATSIGKMERRAFTGHRRNPRLMAIVARNSHMSTGQRKLGISMLGDCEQRAMEILNGMTRFAAIVVRSGGELPVVSILVAIQARCKFHVV